MLSPQILERTEEGKDKAPGIIKEEINGGAKADAADSTSFASLLALGQMENIAAGGHGNDAVTIGHKFGLPTLPIPSTNNLKHRYDPLITQVTNLLMKDGKKSVAQRVSLNILSVFW